MITFQEMALGEGILLNAFKVYSIHAPTFGMYVVEATPYGFWLITTLNDLFMSLLALFKCQYIITHN